MLIVVSPVSCLPLLSSSKGYSKLSHPPLCWQLHSSSSYTLQPPTDRAITYWSWGSCANTLYLWPNSQLQQGQEKYVLLFLMLPRPSFFAYQLDILFLTVVNSPSSIHSWIHYPVLRFFKYVFLTILTENTASASSLKQPPRRQACSTDSVYSLPLLSDWLSQSLRVLISCGGRWEWGQLNSCSKYR